MQKTYRILDGTRRAKAAELAGYKTIWAQLAGRGEGELRLPIESLLSPKSQIDISSPTELDRWLAIAEGMAEEPDLLPPIIVKAGSKGTPIRNVRVVGQP